MIKLIKTHNLSPAIFATIIFVGLFLISCVDNDPLKLGIDNEPAAAVGFENNEVEVLEGTSTTFEVNASKPLFNDINFKFKVLSGNGSEVTITDEYGNTGPYFVMKAQTDLTVINVTIANDDVYTGTREVVYALEDLVGAGAYLEEQSVGSGDEKINGQLTLTIIDDEPVPLSVNFTDTDSTIDENAGVAQQVRLELTEPAIASGSFDVLFSGTALDGVDYSSNATDGVLTINVNENDTEFFVEVTPIDNDEVSGDKTVVLTLSNPSNGFQIGAINEHNLTIIDEDLPTVYLNPEADCSIRGGDNGNDLAAGGEYARIANGTDIRGRDERQMMLRFDLSGIELNDVISAELRLTSVGIDANGSDRFWTNAENFAGGPTSQRIYHVTGSDNWDETTVTWNSAPAFALTPIAIGQFDLVGENVVTHEFDVMDALVLDTDGKFSIRIGIDDDTDGKPILYQSRESTLGGVPVLKIISSQ